MKQAVVIVGGCTCSLFSFLRVHGFSSASNHRASFKPAVQRVGASSPDYKPEATKKDTTDTQQQNPVTCQLTLQALSHFY